MSHQESGLEVVVAVVAGGGEDVGHASGRTAATRAKRSRWDVVPRRRNWASATPNQVVGLAVQKSGSLKKQGGACQRASCQPGWRRCCPPRHPCL